MRALRRSTAGLMGLTLLAAACGGDGGGGGGDQAGSEPVASEAAPSADAPADGEAPAPRGRGPGGVDRRPQGGPGPRESRERFGEDNGISVAVQVVTDLQANFITANNAGNGPDVVVGAHDWIGNMVQNGAVDPLQLTPDQLGQYSDLAVEATTFEGSLYGLPYGVESLVLYRNTDAAPDEPASLEEAFDAGEAAVAAGTVESPFNLPVGELGDAYHMQPLYTSAGGYVFGGSAAEGYDPQDLGVGQPGSVEAAQRIYDLGEAGRGILAALRQQRQQHRAVRRRAGRLSWSRGRGPWRTSRRRASPSRSPRCPGSPTAARRSPSAGCRPSSSPPTARTKRSRRSSWPTR